MTISLASALSTLREPCAAMSRHAPASRTAVDEMIAARRKGLA